MRKQGMELAQVRGQRGSEGSKGAGELWGRGKPGPGSLGNLCLRCPTFPGPGQQGHPL